MGELFGGGDAKKAAKEQAAATREAARLQSQSANYQAEAAAQQMTLAQEQHQQQQLANDLLSKPMDSATVDLASDDNADEGDDLLTKRRTTRQTYQSDRSSGLAV